MSTHLHIHIHIHSHTHSHTHIHTQSLSHIHTHSITVSHSHSRSHTQSLSHSHRLTLTFTHTRSLFHTHNHCLTFTFTGTLTHPHPLHPVQVPIPFHPIPSHPVPQPLTELPEAPSFLPLGHGRSARRRRDERDKFITVKPFPACPSLPAPPQSLIAPWHFLPTAVIACSWPCPWPCPPSSCPTALAVQGTPLGPWFGDAQQMWAPKSLG